MDELNPEANLTDKGQHDYVLIKAALENKDQKAFAELLSRYRDSVYFTLLKMVNNRDDADDLTIEAFGKAFNRLDQYTPNYAFSTWLFRIATNNAIDFIRKKRMVTYSLDKTFENEEGSERGIDVKSESLNPEENFIKKQKVKHVRVVVDKLKPHYKQLIEMRYYQELSYEEISQKLEMPIGTVKAQLFRAREFLANILRRVDGKI
jgi:RNA polymerase sigma-70 factor (ECF subfamily)